MLQILPGGFCFRCDAEYSEMGHDCPKKWDAVPDNPQDTPAFKAYQWNHPSEARRAARNLLTRIIDMVEAEMAKDDKAYDQAIKRERGDQLIINSLQDEKRGVLSVHEFYLKQLKQMYAES
jgi:hypothetical protein